MTTPRPGPLVATLDDLAKGRRTSRNVVDECLSQIDRRESSVRAWTHIDRDGALAQAKVLDQSRRPVGPLHGIPIGVKDIIDVQGLPTSAGFGPWSDRVATQDAPIVVRLKAAGAIILGKTVTTPFAWIDPPPTRNPRNPDRTPGGSSSGSAAAVATGMCLGALGSQTGGSITRPASYCGVCGFKPSFGALDTEGIVPLAPSLDHPGIIASTVADLARVWRGLAGRDGRWALKDPPTLGRVRGYFDDLSEPAMARGFDHALRTLANAGAAIHDASMPPAFDAIPRHFRTILAFEAAQFHRDLLAQLPDDYPPWIRTLVEDGNTVDPSWYVDSRNHQDFLKSEIRAPLDRFEALIVPATRDAAPDRDTTGDPAFNIPWSYAGLPTVSLPFGLDDDGMPMAIQLVGLTGDEEGLLALAAWCEQAIAYDPGGPPS